MKFKLLALLLLVNFANASELQIKANSFNADENTGISVFNGNVSIQKEHDELNASKVVVYTNKKNEPIKFVANGKVSFMIETKQGAIYTGKAEKVIYLRNKKEYHFFKNVHLKQLDDKKEIIGDEVLLNTIEGRAYAKGVQSEPVIMIFNIKEKEEKK